MKNSMCVKVLKPFRSPLTNRMVEIGALLNVSENIFWLRRIEAKDCERTKNKKRSEIGAVAKGPKDEKKGSK